MVIVHVSRSFLERRGACQEALDFFDTLSPEEVASGEWTDTHYLWMAIRHAPFLTWLRCKGLVGPINLAGIDLRDVDLTGAELRGADLVGADLRGTNLAQAQIARANLTGALADEAPEGWILIDGVLERVV